MVVPAITYAWLGGLQAAPRQGPVEHVALHFRHRPGVEAVRLQTDDGLLADQCGLSQPLAEVEAGGEQPRDRAIVRALGQQDFKLADDLAVMPRPYVGLDPSQQRGYAQVRQVRDMRAGEWQVCDIGQRPASPQRERIPEMLSRLYENPE